MPSQLSYPGVYIEELSSGVRTISGVSTSITAFVGWAPKGPTDRALRVFNFSDFVRTYGGIHPKSYLGYAIQHYFNNGGNDAYVLRLADPESKPGELDAKGLKIFANSPGVWSNFYGVSITLRDEPNEDRFRLSVLEFATNDDGSANLDSYTELETFANLSLDPDDARFAPEIVNDRDRGSVLVRIDRDNLPDAPDASAPVAFEDGDDGALLTPGDDNFNAQLTAACLTTSDGEAGALAAIDLFNLLCVPGLTDPVKLGELAAFCERKRAMLIADSDENVRIPALQKGPGISGATKNAAYFFPWLTAPDALAGNRLQDFPPCGFVAGIFARTDAQRGVWKAPAGIDAALVGVSGPKLEMGDPQNGVLNPRAVNCIRSFPIYGTVLWGARTLDGDDERGSEWKYIPVRRTALFIEESLYRGTKWAVFEPNDEPLWSQLRLNIGVFMHDLFRQGAFQGRTPREAYFVKCDKETTTQSDINRGVVNVLVGFAPLKPAEFVVIKLQQMAGNLET